MSINVKTERNINECYDCKLIDKDVECSGIYYCPNPFCGMSGATGWKIKNLNVKETQSGIELLNYDGWLEKGMAQIESYSEELRLKILALPKTQEQIEELKEGIKWDK